MYNVCQQMNVIFLWFEYVALLKEILFRTQILILTFEQNKQWIDNIVIF